MTSHIKPCMCPSCGYVVDAASAVGKRPARPKAGDISICLNCGSINEFAADLTVRELPMADFLALPASVRDTIATVRAAQASLIKRDLSKRGGHG